MKNKFTRKEMSEVCFDFTGLKGNKIKRITKKTLSIIGNVICTVLSLSVIYFFILFAYAMQ